MNHDLSIEYNGLQLRPMRAEDSEMYRVVRNRKSNRKWFNSDVVISEEMQKKWFKNYIDSEEYMFSAFDNDVYVGSCGLYNIENENAEFGRIVIDDKMRGNGLGYKMIMATIKIAESLNIRYLRLNVKKDNVAAISLYKKAGFITQNYCCDSLEMYKQIM